MIRFRRILLPFVLSILFMTPSFGQEVDMPTAIYISPREAPPPGFPGVDWNRLNLYVHYPEEFSEIVNQARNLGLCIVEAEQFTHDLIRSDVLIQAVGPVFATKTSWRSALNTIFNNISNADQIKARIETLGINTSWVTGTNTVRDVLRYAARVFITEQVSRSNTSMQAVIIADVNSTVGELSAPLRNGAKNWMQDRGLAIGWITNQTTIREVLHFVVTNLGIGIIKLSGEDF